MAENVRQLPVADGTWSKERIELIKRTVCPKGITDDELALFIEQCKRSGLDPLLKQAFCVPRRQNIGTRDNPNWIEKREFQPAEAGMLARAEQFPDYRGCTASAVRAKDECSIDAGSGSVRHVYSPGSARGAVLGAWARVVREGKEPVVVWLEMEGYQQSSPMWSRIPSTMIEKCARVAALRKAYPKAFGGLYIAEELEGGAPPEQAIAPATSKVEAIKGKLTAKLGEPLAAKTSRMVIQDESTGPDRPALPPPSLQTIDAPKARPYDQLTELAAAQATTARELINRFGLPERTKRSDVTAADVALIKERLAKAERAPPDDDLIE